MYIQNTDSKTIERIYDKICDVFVLQSTSLPLNIHKNLVLVNKLGCSNSIDCNLCKKECLHFAQCLIA